VRAAGAAVRVGSDVGGARAVEPAPRASPIPPPPEVEVVVERPSNRAILGRAADLMAATSKIAAKVGQDGVAEVAGNAADLARAIPNAVDGVKREVEPVKRAATGLWEALERRGWVGRRPPIDIATMQGRSRPRKG
jgi:hypothetical protein